MGDAEARLLGDTDDEQVDAIVPDYVPLDPAARARPVVIEDVHDNAWYRRDGVVAACAVVAWLGVVCSGVLVTTVAMVQYFRA